MSVIKINMIMTTFHSLCFNKSTDHLSRTQCIDQNVVWINYEMHNYIYGNVMHSYCFSKWNKMLMKIKIIAGLSSNNPVESIQTFIYFEILTFFKPLPVKRRLITAYASLGHGSFIINHIVINTISLVQLIYLLRLLFFSFWKCWCHKVS